MNATTCYRFAWIALKPYAWTRVDRKLNFRHKPRNRLLRGEIIYTCRGFVLKRITFPLWIFCFLNVGDLMKLHKDSFFFSFTSSKQYLFQLLCVLLFNIVIPLSLLTIILFELINKEIRYIFYKYKYFLSLVYNRVLFLSIFNTFYITIFNCFTKCNQQIVGIIVDYCYNYLRYCHKFIYTVQPCQLTNGDLS